MSDKKRTPKMEEFVDDVSEKLFGLKQSEAKAAGICSMCHKDIGEFRNEISQIEFGISGLCQKCQDSMFGKD